MNQGTVGTSLRVLVLALSVVSPLAAMGETSELAHDDLASVRAVLEEYVQAWLANDADRVLAVFTDDAVLMPHHGDAPVEGAEAIRELWFPSGPAARVTTFEETRDEIGGGGDRAFARGRFELAFEYGDKIYSNAGNYLTLLRREPGGDWKISHRIWNDPVPVATDAGD